MRRGLKYSERRVGQVAILKLQKLSPMRRGLKFSYIKRDRKLILDLASETIPDEEGTEICRIITIDRKATMLQKLSPMRRGLKCFSRNCPCGSKLAKLQKLSPMRRGLKSLQHRRASARPSRFRN